jgi:hypothetical protein
LIAMQIDKSNVEILWNYALVGYILLFGDAIFQIIPKNKPLSLMTKLTTIAVIFLLSVMIICEVESPKFYYAAEWLVISLSLLLIVNYFLKARKA